MPDLVVSGLSKRFGGVQAVRDVSFAVAPGTVHGLIGPNGAGKSTVLGLIGGAIRPDAGTVTWDGRELSGLAPAAVARLGIGRTFQEPTPLAGLDVMENVLVGLHRTGSAGAIRAALRTPGLRREERRLREEAQGWLARLGLADRAGASASELSFGELRALELARTLGSDPRVMLLDEPAAGMGLNEVRRLGDLIGAARDEGRGVLLVEHDMRFVFGICDTITVMDAGAVIAQGAPEEIRASERVRDAYLGTGVAA